MKGMPFVNMLKIILQWIFRIIIFMLLIIVIILISRLLIFLTLTQGQLSIYIDYSYIHSYSYSCINLNMWLKQMRNCRQLRLSPSSVRNTRIIMANNLHQKEVLWLGTFCVYENRFREVRKFAWNHTAKMIELCSVWF